MIFIDTIAQPEAAAGNGLWDNLSQEPQSVHQMLHFI